MILNSVSIVSWDAIVVLLFNLLYIYIYICNLNSLLLWIRQCVTLIKHIYIFRASPLVHNSLATESTHTHTLPHSQLSLSLSPSVCPQIEPLWQANSYDTSTTTTTTATDREEFIIHCQSCRRGNRGCVPPPPRRVDPAFGAGRSIQKQVDISCDDPCRPTVGHTHCISQECTHPPTHTYTE